MKNGTWQSLLRTAASEDFAPLAAKVVFPYAQRYGWPAARCGAVGPSRLLGDLFAWRINRGLSPVFQRPPQFGVGLADSLGDLFYRRLCGLSQTPLPVPISMQYYRS